MKRLIKGFLTFDLVENKNLAAGMVYYRQFKCSQEAENELSKAIDSWMQTGERTDDPAVLAWLAKAHLLNGNLKMADIFLKRLYQRDNLPKEVLEVSYQVEAILHARRGNSELAKKSLNLALSHTPFWKKGRLYLAKACLGGAGQKQSVWNKLKSLVYTVLGVCLAVICEPLFPWLSTALFYSLKALTGFCSSKTRLMLWLGLYQAFPGLSLLSVEIGNLYYRMGEKENAEFWLHRVIKRHPLNDSAYQSLLNLYQSQANDTLLTQTLEKWLLIYPNNGELLLAYSQVLSKSPAGAEEAMIYAKQALAKTEDPQLQANVYMHLGSLYQQANLSPEAASIAYHAVIALQPDNLEAYIQLGTIYYDRSEYLLSQAVFEKALALSPHNARILCNLGYLAWLQEDTTEALHYYQQSIAQDPSYDIALNNLGVLYLDHMGDLTKAMEYFEKTLQVNPRYALCYYNMGRAYSFMDQTVEAAQCFRQAQVLNKDTEELDNAELAERIHQLFEHRKTLQPTDS